MASYKTRRTTATVSSMAGGLSPCGRGDRGSDAGAVLSGDLAENVRQLKETDGPDIHVMGSADMLQTLFKADLVDGLELMIIPVTLGKGKRLFQDGTIPASFKVTSSQVAPKGIISATYERDGDVKSGAPQIKENN